MTSLRPEPDNDGNRGASAFIGKKPTAPPRPSTADRSAEFATPGGVAHFLKGARLLMLMGVVMLLVAATALLVVGVIETCRHIMAMIISGDMGYSNQETILASIKLVDLILLATILQVMALGVYTLFIDPDLPVPSWLRTDNVDDLKRKLAGIVIIMLGVLFLEEAIHWGSDRDLLSFGLSLAAIIVALSFFMRTH